MCPPEKSDNLITTNKSSAEDGIEIGMSMTSIVITIATTKNFSNSNRKTNHILAFVFQN
jgi:hypothetical protein